MFWVFEMTPNPLDTSYLSSEVSQENWSVICHARAANINRLAATLELTNMMNVLFVTQPASVVLVRARPKLYKIVSSQRSYLFSNDVGGGEGGREGELQTNIPLYRIKDRKPAN